MMLELVAVIAVAASMIYDATCLLLCRRELKEMRLLLAAENPACNAKTELRKKARRTARLTDASRKWLASKGKMGKEEG